MLVCMRRKIEGKYQLQKLKGPFILCYDFLITEGSLRNYSVLGTDFMESRCTASGTSVTEERIGHLG